jgi:hypothetical protein
VGGGTAEEGGIDEVGATGTAGHRNVAGGAHRREHGFGAARHLAGRARDHDADGVEDMAARIMAHLIGEVRMAHVTDELDERRGRGGLWGERLQRFGVSQGYPPEVATRGQI